MGPYRLGDDDEEETRNKALSRSEFIDILVRIAKEKYLAAEDELTIAGAFQKLMDEHIQLVNETAEWDGFRKHSLYTLEVQDVFAANREPLNRLYKMFTTWT